MRNIILIIIAFISALYAKDISFIKNQFKATSDWRVNKTTNIVSMIKNNGSYFNTFYTKNIIFSNGIISVYFKANGGYMDQGGGIMWRVQNKNNYYISRFNPLEDNFTYYKVINSRRITLQSSHISLSYGWHRMTIKQNGTHFEGYIDNIKLLEYNDSSIKNSGGIGLWTKSDARTSFKYLNIK